MSESILQEAQRLIHGERNKNYGHPRENFNDIASLFAGYLGIPLDAIDVANLMILVKVARVKGTGYHRDSFTDIAGYAGCVERIYEEPADAPAPRQWQFLNEEIPLGVKVKDSQGDIWNGFNGGRNWIRSRDGSSAADVAWTGPFTEVIEEFDV